MLRRLVQYSFEPMRVHKYRFFIFINLILYQTVFIHKCSGKLIGSPILIELSVLQNKLFKLTILYFFSSSGLLILLKGSNKRNYVEVYTRQGSTAHS